MRRALAIIFVSAFLTVGGLPSRAQESADDGGRAGMCDAYEGLSFTFCVAFCEARECDLMPTDDSRCALLRHGFDDAALGAAPPCAVAGLASALAPAPN